ncbi:hypothetical protein F4805DRAFT_458962 [Annulohypoxylon moriforme]|nr:hypothetical protein F4805DRAFT_458962 [Annulohypoxylon moriforme]
MPTKLAACDPCRSSKLGCDHGRPVCSRCRDKKQPDACVYRLNPFKKRRRQPLSSKAYECGGVEQQPVDSSDAHKSLKRFLIPHSYPNTGFLGPSSHKSFFAYIPSGNNDTQDAAQRPGWRHNDNISSNGKRILEELHNSSQISSCFKLIQAWIRGGTNLALASPLTGACANFAKQFFDDLAASRRSIPDISNSLFLNSCQPLLFSPTSTLEDYMTNFDQHKIRWETLGLAFTAASRATLDIIRFDSIYDSEEERRGFQRFTMHYSDVCLEMALSVDCLSDLQLVLQYENFILHSFVDGDQSYYSWRRLGDVISSLFALGYHEDVGNESQVPDFLISLRQAAFLRAYSADKNVSIFLGRPLRMHKSFCRFQHLGLDLSTWGSKTTFGLRSQWAWGDSFSYIEDTRWSAICAVFKEEILSLFQEESLDNRMFKVNCIQEEAESQWSLLPSRFQLKTDLKSLDCHPVERDFAVSVRLNYLHVLFLLQLTLIRRLSQPSDRLVTIATEILGLVIEAIVLKEQLANSGTSHVWRVSYYGLAAAGVICIALLNQCFPAHDKGIMRAKAIQDLTVLIVSVENGGLVSEENPNYALLSGAAKPIRGLLTRILSGQPLEPAVERKSQADICIQGEAPPREEQWTPWDEHQNFQDFDMDFWGSLNEHPLLSGNQDDLNIEEILQ